MFVQLLVARYTQFQNFINHLWAPDTRQKEKQQIFTAKRIERGKLSDDSCYTQIHKTIQCYGMRAMHIAYA